MREYMTATMMRQDLFCRGPRARAARVACVHAPAMNQSQHGVCCVGVCEVRAAGASTPPRTGSTRHRTARARRGGRYRHINCSPAPTGGPPRAAGRPRLHNSHLIHIVSFGADIKLRDTRAAAIASATPRRSTPDGSVLPVARGSPRSTHHASSDLRTPFRTFDRTFVARVRAQPRTTVIPPPPPAGRNML